MICQVNRVLVLGVRVEGGFAVGVRRAIGEEIIGFARLFLNRVPPAIGPFGGADLSHSFVWVSALRLRVTWIYSLLVFRLLLVSVRGDMVVVVRRRYFVLPLFPLCPLDVPFCGREGQGVRPVLLCLL